MARQTKQRDPDSERNRSLLGSSPIFTPEVIDDIHIKAQLGRYRMRGFSMFKKAPSFDDLTFLPGTLTRFVIEGYREFNDFNPAELWLVEALRTLRFLVGMSVLGAQIPLSASGQLCIYVSLDEPQRKLGYYGSKTAAPAFKNIAERAANFLNIKPDLHPGQSGDVMASDKFPDSTAVTQLGVK